MLREAEAEHSPRYSMVGLRNLAEAARDRKGKDNCDAIDERYLYDCPDIKCPKVIVSRRRL
jgi:hypothetical protein